MGLSQSSFEAPSEKYTATLYYFAGRGRADQIRWMLAATSTSFTQKTVDKKEMMLRMSERQLPFGQVPLLQIDGLEIVQSQAAVRYLAQRGGLMGDSPEETVKCDMVVEAVRDMLGLLMAAPFKKYKGVAEGLVNTEEWDKYRMMLQTKWAFLGSRFEAILETNLPPSMKRASKGGNKNNKRFTADIDGPVFIVGSKLTYADVMVAHLTTWMVEECGGGSVTDFPLLISLQNSVISLPGVQAFIKSSMYFPIGDLKYVQQVETVLSRD